MQTLMNVCKVLVSSCVLTWKGAINATVEKATNYKCLEDVKVNSKFVLKLPLLELVL